jgi:hypothetical protein
MIRLTRLTVFSFLLASASIGVAQDDASLSAGLEAHVDGIFAAIGTGDYTTLRATDDSFSIFDVGNDLTPFVATGSEWNARLDTLEGLLASTGASVSYEVSNRACHATTAVGYCAVLYQTVSGMDDAPQTHQWQMTIVARQVEGSWILVHVHNSPG